MKTKSFRELSEMERDAERQWWLATSDEERRLAKIKYDAAKTAIELKIDDERAARVQGYASNTRAKL